MEAFILFLLCVLARGELQNDVNVEEGIDLPPQLYTKFAEMEKLIWEQGVELSALKHLALQQDAELLTLKQQLQAHDTEMLTLKQQLQAQDTEMLTLKQQIRKELTEEAGGARGRNGALVVRADDGGPLESVVAQLSQHVSKMDADLQAFETQTAADITHARQQASLSIQNLHDQITADIAALNNANVQQSAAIKDAQTSTFVHWGKSMCGPRVETVYSGVIGGSLSNETGAATNYLCLTLEPVFGPSKHYGAHLYGTEYETRDANQDKDAVCAVCRVPFTTSVMVPGTSACSNGWLLQYHGYLMAGGYGEAAGSEFICVDARPDFTIHGELNQNGRSLFYTSASCGSLPCTPYEDGKTVVCAVCSA